MIVSIASVMAGKEVNMNQEIVKVMSALTKAGGGVLTATAVEQEARDESSPLHEHFEWDDSVAGYKYRLEQARELIRSVRLDVEIDEKIVKVPKYVHEPNDGEQRYVETSKIRGDKRRAQDALAYELRRLEAALERVLAVADGLGLSGDVVEIKDKVKAAVARLMAA